MTTSNSSLYGNKKTHNVIKLSVETCLELNMDEQNGHQICLCFSFFELPEWQSKFSSASSPSFFLLSSNFLGPRYLDGGLHSLSFFISLLPLDCPMTILSRVYSTDALFA